MSDPIQGAFRPAPIEMTAVELNRACVNKLRAEIARRGVQNVINGQHVPALSGATFDTLVPTDNTLITQVASSDAADIDQAARAAMAAFPAWRDMPAKERKRLLHRVADLIE